MTGAIAEALPDAAYQRRAVRFCRNVLSKAPKSRRRQAAAMLKAVNAREFFDAGMGKAESVAPASEKMRLKRTAGCTNLCACKGRERRD